MNRKFLIIGIILFSGIFLVTSCSPRITINSPSEEAGRETAETKPQEIQEKAAEAEPKDVGAKAKAVEKEMAKKPKTGANKPLATAGAKGNKSATDTGKTTTPLKLSPSSYLPEIPRISVEEVKAKLDADTNIIIIDSRSAKSYQKFHIAGAISLPFSIERPLGDMVEPYSGEDTRLSNYDEIITYCT